MSNEHFTTMLERIEQKLGVFITNGATSGFKFDDKCADRLNDIREDIVYMFDRMQDKIDVLNDVVQHSKFSIDAKETHIKKLYVENAELQKKVDTAFNSLQDYHNLCRQQEREIEILKNEINCDNKTWDERL